MKLFAVVRRLRRRRDASEQATHDDRDAQQPDDDAHGPITQYAKSANIDLIVIGTNGRGALAQILVGSVAERVVRTAPCPVLTVRHPDREFVMPDASTERSAVGRPNDDAALVAVTQAER